MLAVSWDPCSRIGGVVLFPLPVALAVQQYRGTFRYNSDAALISSVILFIIVGGALAVFAVAIGEAFMEGDGIRWGSWAVDVLSVGMFVAVSAWMNLSWSRRLVKWTSSGDLVIDRSRFSLRELLVVVAAVACVAALTLYSVRTELPRYAENVTRDRAPAHLPAKATEISYCQGYRGTIAFEFTIDEEDFVRWVESSVGSFESEAANVSLQPIKKYYSIQRFQSLLPESPSHEGISITEGLFYEWSKEDRGIHVAFDRKTKRAYYYAHSH